MKSYEIYKNANEKWFNQYPNHWQLKKIKEVFSQRKEKNSPIITTNVLSLSAKNGVLPVSEKTDKGGNKPKEDLSKYSIARENDLLVNCMNIVSGAAGVSKWFGAISPVYYALYLRDPSMNVMFYHYLFRLSNFQKSLLGLGKGILMIESISGKLNTVRMRIPMSSLGNILLPTPPIDEQNQMVKYLDWQVSKINKLINAKKRQIALLNEQKQAIINNAVTKGLDDNVTKKDSGVDWIGAIPKSWEMIKIKHCATLYNGKEVEEEIDKSETHYNVYGSGGIFKSTHDFLYDGVAVLFGRKGTIGKPLLINEAFWTVDTMYYCVVKEKCLARYLYNVLRIFPWIFYATKTALPSIVGTQIFNCSICLPCLKEQNEIVEFIEQEHSIINAIIVKCINEIELLIEYKTSIISSIVTGKIDVREVVVPEFAMEDELIDEVENEEIVDEELDVAEEE